MVFWVSVPDANAPFRLMKADTVKKYLYRMAPDYNLPNIMMTTFLAYYKESKDLKRYHLRRDAQELILYIFPKKSRSDGRI